MGVSVARQRITLPLPQTGSWDGFNILPQNQRSPPTQSKHTCSDSPIPRLARTPTAHTPTAHTPRGPFNAACSTSYYYSRPKWIAFLRPFPYLKTHQNCCAHLESRKFTYSIGLQHGHTKMALQRPLEIFKTPSALGLVLPIVMKFGTHLHHAKTHQKASWHHGEITTGSRPSWIEISPKGRFWPFPHLASVRTRPRDYKVTTSNSARMLSRHVWFKVIKTVFISLTVWPWWPRLFWSSLQSSPSNFEWLSRPHTLLYQLQTDWTWPWLRPQCFDIMITHLICGAP